jgi:PAS domain S-box-containing protein
MQGPDTERDLVDLLESSPAGSVIVDDNDNQVLFWNSSVLSILGGLKGESFAAAARIAFFHNQADYEQARLRLAATGTLRDFETRIWREDGHEAWAAVTMRPMRFEGRPATLIWYIDITDSRRRQLLLERSQDTLLNVLDNAPLGAAISDGPGRISYWNTTLLQVLDAEKGDVGAIIRESVARAHAHVAAHGPGHGFQLPVGGGAFRDVAAWRAELIFEGAPADLIWLQDMTKERQAERAAQAAARAKSDFLATMSHEIRTPMNGVITVAELLAETEITADQRKMLGIIRGSADGLLRVINDILDFSKAEAGQLHIEKIPFRVRELLNGVQQLLAAKAAEKGLALNVEVEESLADTRIGDPLRIRQVLLNLVGNAIKFTARGGVTLRASYPGRVVAFSVIDSGIGIPPDKLADLFQPFRQASSNTTRRFGGTGLGLSISRSLVTLMGGNITAESTQGAGSTFTMTLPLPVTALAPPEAMPSPGALLKWEAPDQAEAEARGVIVLCAEDNDVNRTVLGRLLDRIGVRYVMAEDGQAALDALDRQRIGMLLTDGHMPNLDGWHLTETIRRQEAELGLPRLPILMASADAMPDARQNAESIGVDDFFTKPLRREEVETMLLRHLPILGELRRPAGAPAPSGSPSPDPAASISALDLSGLIDLIGDSPEDLKHLLDDFMNSARTGLGGLRAALGQNDLKCLATAAHTLKGAARYAGATRLGELCDGVEQGAKSGRPAADFTSAVDAIALEIDTLPAAIDRALAAI